MAKCLEEKCPNCQSPLVERQGRFGKFIACSGYPKCRYTRKAYLERSRKERK
ncbi:MAG: topoisomerase DNA-binding C4 zinc finger domain-containing protein [candidate division WOR-3 bacterium]